MPHYQIRIPQKLPEYSCQYFQAELSPYRFDNSSDMHWRFCRCSSLTAWSDRICWNEHNSQHSQGIAFLQNYHEYIPKYQQICQSHLLLFYQYTNIVDVHILLQIFQYGWIIYSIIMFYQVWNIWVFHKTYPGRKELYHAGILFLFSILSGLCNNTFYAARRW